MSKKPVYKRWWFILLIIIVRIGAMISGREEKEKVKEGTAAAATQEKEAAEEIVYEKYRAQDLISALEGNALKANRQFEGKYLEITGTLGIIDASGKYIGIDSSDDSFTLIGITAHTQSEDQINQIIEYSKGDPITVRVEVDKIGEILGYSVNIMEIVK